MNQTTLLSVEEALERLLQRLSPVETEAVSLEGAVGRVLAEPAVASTDLPPFANAAMDGYAVRAGDVAGAGPDHPVTLKVVADVGAGLEDLPPIGAGEAARIMTGAPLPPGADAVVPVEDTSTPEAMAGTSAPSEVRVLRAVRSGDYVRPAGLDVRRGETVLAPGRRLRPADVGMLAAVGVSRPRVYRRPRVAILSTGDELVEVHEPLRPGKIRDSNSYALLAACRQAGAEAVRLGVAPDLEEAVEAKLEEAAMGADLLLSSAGVSMGARDYVRLVLERRGELGFWRVNIRPGKPLAFGRYQDLPFLGLPGNPVSALVTFEVFVRPVLARLAGLARVERLVVRARLEEPVKSDGRESYLRAHLEWREGEYLARLAGSQDSSVLSSLVKANALVVIPAGVRSVEAGEAVEAWLLGWL